MSLPLKNYLIWGWYNMTTKYALISEGVSDVYSIRIICQRLALLEGREIELDDDLSHPANGPITENMVKIRVKQFYSNDVIFGVCLSDTDKNKYNEKITSLNNMVRKAQPVWYDKIVIGSPCRNLEAWLLADEDCVKKQLSLDGAKALPFRSESDPKNRLLQLAAKYGDDSLTPQSLRKLLAEQMDLEIVAKKNNSFSKFKDNFLRVLKVL